MTAFKLQRLSGGGSENKKNDRLRGDPRLLGQLSFPDGNYLVASPIGYDSMQLQFLVPSAFLGYTRLAVVRSTYGFPMTKHDGVTVFEYPNTATPVTQTFIDTNFGKGLKQGQWYYYTLFAKMVNTIPNWQRVDTDFNIVTVDFGSGDDLWGKIPPFYRQLDANTVQRTLTYTSGGQLRRFVDLIGYEVDIIRTELESLLDVNNPSEMVSFLLQLQGYDFGLPEENAIGDARYRALVTNALAIREEKGTFGGLSLYISSLTDYDVRLKARRNFITSSVQARNQAPEGATPNIFATVSPIAHTATVSGSSWQTIAALGITQPTLNGYSVVTWMFRLAVLGSGDVYITNSSAGNGWQANGSAGTGSNATVMQRAQPIPTPGVAYDYSVIATAGTIANAGPVQVRFVWYDANGNFISADSHAISGSPSVFPATPTVIHATSNAAPSNAAYVDPQMYFSASTGNFQFYISGQMLQYSTGFDGTYEDPHSVNIQLIAQRVNLVQNPSAEVDSTLWTGTNMTSLVGITSSNATAGAKVFRITCSASANPRMTTNTFMPINATFIQSMRFDAIVPNTSIGINAIILWYDGATTPNLIRTDTLNFPAPLPTTVMRTYVFGNVVPPSNAVQAKVAMEFTGTANGNVIDVDSVFFGPGPPMFYFDGDTQDGLDTPIASPSQFSDFQWGGTQGKSTSYFYNNYYVMQKRLAADLPNWLPAGPPAGIFTLFAP